MKLIIAGGRDLHRTAYEIGDDLLGFGIFHEDLDEIVSGEADGIDTCGERFAEENEIKIRKFPAEWSIYKKGAGPIRNGHMAKYADALLLIWNGKSTGSKNMKEQMEKLNKPVYEVVI